MNKLILLVQLLFVCGIYCYSTPEECLIELNCNDDVNCVASCYNVPSPDNNSVTKTADCQNGCLAKYPNNLPTDWENLNQCYLDCVQNNYFHSPAGQVSSTNSNTDSNTSSTSTTTENTSINDDDNNNSSIKVNDTSNTNTNTTNIDISTNNTNTNSTNTNSDSLNSNTNTNSTINTNIGKTNQTSNGHPINATDHLPNVLIEENSFIPRYSLNQTLITIALIFIIYITFN
ncbi:hypothetical protein H8356DRAFT_1686099 [Neocallimastix lanati (nom. inval.)]|jgi:hypothetical protein|uniref:Extracellular membrane protein CFEM domain-containing protein n=1 Tax=Neocallimastix californiae TaxID=1754190 RepID=A0A1Y1ZYP6_9FUNG|nr:hypothetical protein H8356DRAFT_1686099 [Neocallimastix sp. JGI-2020a]ORY15362.1 hypothetical protein LY90DRAFT_177398 [Neocallimastix californiae]|eukprot:ORY15362.1 hypothetical protein LY90DRAFT_177398 [Neocallimastix californiae]